MSLPTEEQAQQLIERISAQMGEWDDQHHITFIFTDTGIVGGGRTNKRSMLSIAQTCIELAMKHMDLEDGIGDDEGEEWKDGYGRDFDETDHD